MTKFLQGVRTTNEASWVVRGFPNNSKVAAAASLNLGKNVNNSGLDIHCPKKVHPLMFDHNFGKCGPIFRIRSPVDS